MWVHDWNFLSVLAEICCAAVWQWRNDPAAGSLLGGVHCGGGGGGGGGGL